MHAQTDPIKPAYDYSLPREKRIKLAESAAPPEISGKATVYLLERAGYVKVREGTNGFSLLRGSPDPSKSGAHLLRRRRKHLDPRHQAIFAEQLRAKGKSEEEINAAIQDGYKTGKFHAPRKPGIVYTMSNSIYLYLAEHNQVVHVPPHLMFYALYATDKDIGSPPQTADMPHLIRPGQPDAYIIVVPSEHAAH